MKSRAEAEDQPYDLLQCRSGHRFMRQYLRGYEYEGGCPRCFHDQGHVLVDEKPEDREYRVACHLLNTTAKEFHEVRELYKQAGQRYREAYKGQFGHYPGPDDVLRTETEDVN